MIPAMKMPPILKEENKPKHMTKPRQSPTPVRLPDDLKKKLLAKAKKENRTLSNMIITLLQQSLG